GKGGSSKGWRCGDTTCNRDQVCCIDCDGKGLCGASGTVCPGTACTPKDGGIDGGEGSDGGSKVDGGGMPCGESTCRGQVCCRGCGGDQAICLPPGSACAGFLCKSDGGVPCGATTCSQGYRCLTCCGTSSCVPENSGAACPDIACPLGCGS